MGIINPALTMYVVYENPSDYPGKFVVRRWLIYRGVRNPTKLAHAVGTSLEDVRCSIPHGLIQIDRSPSDDPVIVETWV